MLDDSEQKPVLCLATWLYVEVYGSARPRRKRTRAKITIKWLHRHLHQWMHGNGTESRVTSYIAEINDEMAEEIARRSLLPYDRTKASRSY